MATAERRNAEGATWREPTRALRVVGVAEARTPVMETVMAAIFSVRRLGRDEEWVFSRLRVHECAPTRVGDGLSGAVGRVEFPDRDFFRSRSIFISIVIGGERAVHLAGRSPVAGEVKKLTRMSRAHTRARRAVKGEGDSKKRDGDRACPFNRYDARDVDGRSRRARSHTTRSLGTPRVGVPRRFGPHEPIGTHPSVRTSP